VTVSVIVPTYNRPRLLMERCIPSILAQTDPDWECHVVGDGTDDETCALMADLCARDGRFRFTNLPHYDYVDEGAGVWGLIGLPSLNHGLDTALGDWIAVLADDDEYTPDHNEVLRCEAERLGVDFCYGIAQSPSGQRWGAWPPGDGQIANGAYVYRGAAREYRYDMRCLWERGLNGDADLWTRMYRGGVTFALLPQVVHHYEPSATRA
jgi:glycosyltransferase involved in cell wall biosynthesis